MEGLTAATDCSLGTWFGINLANGKYVCPTPIAGLCERPVLDLSLRRPCVWKEKGGFIVQVGSSVSDAGSPLLRRTGTVSAAVFWGFCAPAGLPTVHRVSDFCPAISVCTPQAYSAMLQADHTAHTEVVTLVLS